MSENQSGKHLVSEVIFTVKSRALCVIWILIIGPSAEKHRRIRIYLANINSTHTYIVICNSLIVMTSPPEGVARYCFHPSICVMFVCLCVCVCVCVRPIFWYFISRILEDISIVEVKGQGQDHRDGTLLLKVQSYHKT